VLQLHKKNTDTSQVQAQSSTKKFIHKQFGMQ